MQIPRSELHVGDVVHVRRQRWRIREIRDFEDCRVVTVAGAGPLNQGMERQFLAPFDRVAPVAGSGRPQRIRSRTWRRVAQMLVCAAGPADSLRTAAAARIDVLPHQLEPAMALLRGMGSRLLLADEVGLGKTVQAALCIAELRARGLADRILIVTPAGLRDQWHVELARRFTIEACGVDARELRRRTSVAPLGVNPWTTVDVAIVSIDFVKRPEILPGALEARWDVVVVDEAHGASPPSDRHAAAAALCNRTSYVLLLTATPHNGDRSAFEALCSLGALGDPLLLFRRTRHDVSLGVRRRIHRLSVTPSLAERLMHERLSAFARAVRLERGDDAAAVALSLGTLFKRAFSSPWSLLRTVERRLEVLDSDAGHLPLQIGLPFDLDGESADTRDEPPGWAIPSLADVKRERRFLEEIIRAARDASAADSKLRVLTRLLRRLSRLREPAIVFTEYRDTLSHLQRSVVGPTAILHGGLTRDERLSALEAFRTGRAASLLATDAAGEGLNLQTGCRAVINLELPWNPNRLEQRAGRVDRIGQSKTVHAFHLIAHDVGEARILDRLTMRIRQARTDIDVSDPLDIAPALSTPDIDAELRSRPATSLDTGAEHERLVTARRLTTPAPIISILDDAPRVAVGGRRLRMSLRGRALALVTTTLEDPTGRPIATELDGALVELAGGAPRSPTPLQIADLMRRCEATVATVRSGQLEAWTIENRTLYRQLLESRIARDIAVCDAASGESEQLQLGLFDRRAERDAQSESARLFVWKGQVQERTAQIQSTTDTRLVTRVSLLLLP